MNKLWKTLSGTATDTLRRAVGVISSGCCSSSCAASRSARRIHDQKFPDCPGRSRDPRAGEFLHEGFRSSFRWTFFWSSGISRAQFGINFDTADSAVVQRHVRTRGKPDLNSGPVRTPRARATFALAGLWIRFQESREIGRNLNNMIGLRKRIVTPSGERFDARQTQFPARE